MATGNNKTTLGKVNGFDKIPQQYNTKLRGGNHT